MPKGALDQWEAFDAVEPIGEQWRQTAQISNDIRSLINTILWSNGVKDTQDWTINDCMPTRYVRPKRKKQKIVINKPLAPVSFFSRFGFSKEVIDGGNNQPG